MIQEIVTKKCSKCQEVKPITEYNKYKDKIRCHCKKCQSIYHQQNKQHFNKLHKIWISTHKTEIRDYTKQYNSKHKDHQKIIKKQWHNDHKIERNLRMKQRRKKDPVFRIIHDTRIRCRNILQTHYEYQHTIDILGCSGVEYSTTIQSQFYNNMTWETQGKGYTTWQIHHICPIEFFNPNDPIEQKQAWHYSNTKPLWYEDHVEEHRKINERMLQYDPKDIYHWKY